MGKADKEQTKQQIGTATGRSEQNMTSGIDSTQARVNSLAPVSDAMRSNIWDQSAAKSTNPDYNNVYSDLSAASGGINRSGIDASVGQLRDTSGNYGDVNTNINNLTNARNNYGDTNTSITGLQNFAKMGGVSAANIGKIDNNTLNEMSTTGGYNTADRANIRARGNSAIASTYGNMQDQMNKNKIISGQNGPGWDASSRAMTRAAAQDIGKQTQNTEADIQDRVNANRLSAAGQLSTNMLGLSGLQSNNTLTGYGSSGNLANTREAQIQDASKAAMSGGLQRQAQIDAAKEAAAGIDANTSALVNQSRLSAANSANNTSLAGTQGMQNAYSSTPGALSDEENRLLQYRTGDAAQQSNLIQDRIGQGNMPGLGAQISDGLGIAGQVAGMAAPMFGGPTTTSAGPKVTPYSLGY